jgi:hypothetical protein
MALTVRERADTVATFRFVNVRLMEILAAWVPTTPELEVKILFGRHLWDFAQHADAFGHRTAELRLARHSSRTPTAPLLAVLDRLTAAETAAQRVDGFYSGMIPFLEALYRADLEATDELLDEPTVRILKRALWDLERLESDRKELQRAFPGNFEDTATSAELKTLAATASGFVEFRPVEDKSEAVR